MTRKGRFITFEGGEGAGKSTQARLLAERLTARGADVVVTREPGGSPGAEDIRNLLVKGTPGRWDALVEALLMFAARADHVEKTIRPALERGAIVICDRFTDSTYAYQGAGRGLPRETIRRIESIAVPDFKPDLTFILDLPAEEGLKRTHSRQHGETRFEQFDLAFHERLRQSFRDIARQNTARCIVLDSTRDRDVVSEEIWRAVEARCL
ncbi:MAG TPA: dTMP kinase [Rhizomicrobium sp.]|nr:dTMP kinase [Rhizomicrobium sp.]